MYSVTVRIYAIPVYSMNLVPLLRASNSTRNQKQSPDSRQRGILLPFRFLRRIRSCSREKFNMGGAHHTTHSIPRKRQSFNNQHPIIRGNKASTPTARISWWLEREMVSILPKMITRRSVNMSSSKVAKLVLIAWCFAAVSAMFLFRFVIV